MKFHIEIEATPEEFRESIGLPNIKGIQERILVDMEEKAKQFSIPTMTEEYCNKWYSMFGLR